MRSRYSLAVLVLGVTVLGAPFVAVADSDQPYIVFFAEDAVSGSGSARAPGSASGQGRFDRQRVGRHVSEMARRGGFAPTNVFSNVAAGFAARLTGRQVQALRGDPTVAQVVPDVRVTVDEPSTQDGKVTATIIKVTDARVPAGVKRVGANQNFDAALDQIDQRVDADVAILDTGIDRTHPDLNIAGGYNCTGSNRDNWNDVYGHGTHVAGTVAALDNEFGVVGVAPGARLWAVKIMGNDGSGLMSWILCGIDWVAAQRADGKATIEAANMSIRVTGDGKSRDCGVPTGDAMHKAVCRAVAGGTVFVAAAGNDKKNAKYARPAAYDEAITVSAMADYDGKPGSLSTRPSGCSSGTPDDAWASFSNFGAKVDLIAPGVCVLSTYAGGQYAYASGTSMSAPHVTGAAALYLVQYPTAKPQQVRMALEHVATFKWRTGTDPDGNPDPLLWVAAFEPAPDFGVAGGVVGGSGYVGQGASHVPFTLQRSNGHTAPVSVTLTGLPSGVTAVARTTSSSSGSVTVNVGSSARSGRYAVSVKANDGELVHTANYELAVDADAPTASFSSPNPGLAMQSANYATVAWKEADAGGSGLAGRTLQRQRGRPSAPGDCSAVSWANDGAARTTKSDYTDPLTSGYCYRWLLTVNDKAGNRTVVSSGSVLVDTSAPSRPDIGVAGSTSTKAVPGDLAVPAAWADGRGTVWLRGGGSGRIDLALAAHDAESGVAAISLNGSASGWTVPASVAGSTPTARLNYTSSAGTLQLSVRASNGAGTMGNAAAVTIRRDGTAPSPAAWVTPAGGLTVTGTSVLLAWSGGSDAASGLADAHFVRGQRAPATSGGGCGTFSTNGNAVLMTSGTTVDNLRVGYCYRWRLRTSDRVGNMAAAVMSGKVRVTASVPTSEPSVSAVSAAPGAGTRLTTGGSVRVRVGWATTAGALAVSGHEVRVSSDGGATWDTPRSVAASASSITLLLKPAAGYLVGVRSGDSEGRWSDWKTTGFDLRLVQGEGSAVAFAGGWTKAGMVKASGGAVRYSKNSGATARLSFTGRSLSLVATTAPTRGKADVYLDGKLVTTLDLYSATADFRRLVFSHGWASSGSHTVEVRVKGTSGRPRVDVDAFVILD